MIAKVNTMSASQVVWNGRENDRAGAVVPHEGIVRRVTASR
jgi:hypothetical protein